ncbi:MAG: NAD(P)-binding domain-containing protein [Acidipropionibacterium sp.]|jgi:pyrroline-5-carboxylate reductase|nr:NAD(P)-binding domain-containing protein [Acidipropionibacterium sp.]
MDRISSATVGVVGVGEIAGAMVEGLMGGADGPARVTLSPRGRRRAADLAGRLPRVEVAASNQEVVDAADILVLSMRPEQLHEAVDDLRLRAGQTVISVLAGVSIAELRQVLHTDLPICRAIPLPPVARRGAVTVITPGCPIAASFFDLLGGSLLVAGEPELAVISTLTGCFTGLLEYIRVASDWAEDQGIPRQQIEEYLRDAVAGLGPALRDREMSMDRLIVAHETPGGLNEQLRTEFFDTDTRAALRRSLDGLLSRVTR